jgi:16S rRNA processing protein RimM
MISGKLIKIAIITGAHGVRGEVKLRILAENTDFLTEPLILFDGAGKKKFSIKITGKAKDNLIARIEGVIDRNSAESMKNTELFTAASDLPAPDEGEFYYSQLIGLDARNENGDKLGEITSVNNFGAGDVIEITTVSGETEMLPFSEPWIGEINLEQGYVVITQAEYV